jgi:prepilin-type N-terminal cleavage/methylation domain-containing protein
MRAFSIRSGFTMIEIIIAISLIGLFVTVPILAYSNYVKSSRDIRRKNDINQVQAALEQYKSRIGKYPTAENLQILQETNLLPDIPTDPLQGQPIPGEDTLVYNYAYTPSEDLQDYQLLARLESKPLYYQGTPIGNTEVGTDPGTGLPAANTPIPQNTRIPSLSAIPTSTTTPTRTPTPSTIYWSPLSGTGAPSNRYGAASTWTGSKLFIWGGNSNSGYEHDGALYDPTDNSWTAVSATNAPDNINTGDFKTVWTGTKAIIWGDRFTTEGGMYEPSTNTWVAGGMDQTNAPGARYNHSAIWTGTKMIVWGGNNQFSGAFNNGAVFDPNFGTNGKWTAISNSPLNVRTLHTAVWTSTDMIVWGGVFGTWYNDGAKYNPTTDQWTLISSENAPSARAQHVAIWTGNHMIIWGGRDTDGNSLENGAMYDPVLDIWTAMSTTNAPPAGANSRAMLYNGKMIVWGGNVGATGMTNTGGIFDPGIGTNGSWTQISTNNAPLGRIGYAMGIGGTKMYVWGGFGDLGPLGDGAVYQIH